MRERLAHVGANAVGIMFGGCLVVLPADVAVKNLGFLRPMGVPRGYSLVTRRGTRVYDLRKDLQELYHAGWIQACFDKAARDLGWSFGSTGIQSGTPNLFSNFLCLRRVLILAMKKSEAHIAISAMVGRCCYIIVFIRYSRAPPQSSI